MRTLSPEQQAELTYGLNEYSKFSASSAMQISRESDRIFQEILIRDQKAQQEVKIRQEMLAVQKEIAQSAKRQADIVESSEKTRKVTTWISRGTALTSLIISLTRFLLRK